MNFENDEGKFDTFEFEYPNGISDYVAELAGENPLTKITLSMACFKYDALLKIAPEKHTQYILSDIEKRYLAQLDAGATSFWETIKGASDFGNSGSLCHGWSSVPIYFYHKLEIAR